MSLHVEAFSNKVRTMNQTNSKHLMLSSDEARNLHTEIFVLLARLAEAQPNNDAANNLEVSLDGGKFNL